MRHGFIKIAAATPEIRVADCAFNAAQLCDCMDRAAIAGVKVLVLPELCVTGCTCGDLFLQDALLDAAEQALERIRVCSEGKDMLLAIGMPLRHMGKLYNCAAALHAGKLLGIIPKTYTSNAGALCKQFFALAPDMENSFLYINGKQIPFGPRQLFQCESVQGLSVGIEIGEDACGPLPPSVALCEAGATLVLNPAASGELVGREEYRRLLLRSHSARLCCAYAAAEAGAGESTTNLVFSGHNLIAENGRILKETAPFAQDAFAITEIDLQRLQYERRRRNAVGIHNSRFIQHTFTLRIEETTLTRSISPSPFLPGEGQESGARCERILQIQAHGLMKRIAHTQSKAAVIGVSGGLDSTLALLVCLRAMQLLGRPVSDIHAITMPCFGTTQRTRGNAERLCDCLGIPCRTVDITAAVQQHFSDIGQKESVYDAAFENAQARERTQVLMDIANQVGGIVVGTGDLSELALGWATYNGDHMSMYAVNNDIPKTLVQYMVRYAADTAEENDLRAVLLDILDTPVSPELLPAQNGEISQITESAVGPYALHDFFMYHMLRWGCPPEKLLRLANYAFSGIYDENTIKEWLCVFLRRFFSQQFKRSCMPDGPKVGTVSLSPRGDWHMPSDASAAVWYIE